MQRWRCAGLRKVDEERNELERERNVQDEGGRGWEKEEREKRIRRRRTKRGEERRGD